MTTRNQELVEVGLEISLFGISYGALAVILYTLL